MGHIAQYCPHGLQWHCYVWPVSVNIHDMCKKNRSDRKLCPYLRVYLAESISSFQRSLFGPIQAFSPVLVNHTDMNDYLIIPAIDYQLYTHTNIHMYIMPHLLFIA